MTSAVKFLLPLFFLLLGCGQEKILKGETMGTTWTVRVVATDDKNLQSAIETELKRINRIFSNWDPQSDVNRFNRHNSQKPFEINRDFYVVMNVSLQVARDSKGAFDPTLSDLIDTSGFGTKDTFDRSPEAVKKASMHTGWQKLQTLEQSGKYYLAKSDPEIRLNLSAVAKGYGVDALYLLLKLRKIDNFLVEIGGEVRTSGLNKDKQPWKVGIESPDSEGIYKVVALSDMAIATSGGYRNFISGGNEKFIHILDPQTGLSLNTDIESVSIIMPNCTYADALATAVSVLGTQKGPALLQHYKYSDLLILYRKDNTLQEIATPGMKHYLKK